ncbi:hypothetical protein BDA99DRAFT_575317 [Phascolomyces articulosus]|uniref:Uncharacterized protein n=1 Tax=Phascolomyces articulosus TaxID=60185 RepID=A0AAD5K2H0_9FUNG|nr:hypothetical protein BDA99DRAFT_575317 [Phascolomyces articulosus]
MDQNKRWQLSSGKMVEDVMYDFGSECTHEHPVHSFILNVKGPCWKSKFNDVELREISTFGNTSLPALDEKIKNIFSKFKNPPSSKLLQHVVQIAKNTTSKSPLMRINDERSLTSTFEINSKKRGVRPDLMLIKHGLEMGYSELGVILNPVADKKTVIESQLRSPKTMKDTFQAAAIKVDYDSDTTRKIKVICFNETGLSVVLSIMDSPCRYVCRVVNSNKYTVPSEEEFIVSKLFPIFKLVIQAKMIVDRSLESIVSYLPKEEVGDPVLDFENKGEKFVLPTCFTTQILPELRNISYPMLHLQCHLKSKQHVPVLQAPAPQHPSSIDLSYEYEHNIIDSNKACNHSEARVINDTERSGGESAVTTTLISNARKHVVVGLDGVVEATTMTMMIELALRNESLAWTEKSSHVSLTINMSSAISSNLRSLSFGCNPSVVNDYYITTNNFNLNVLKFFNDRLPNSATVFKPVKT